jgi:peptidoglycan/xylan/chitin deacetylase (PgdA/CDA1 family)
MKTVAGAFSALLTASTVFPALAVERPPQFIAIAFDNCTELSRWQELSDFAKELNKDGDKIHFTFFVSGINYLANEKRAAYQGPHQVRGYSMINFGGTPEEIEKRVAYMNELKNLGHEMASHAVGHFDGHSWSAADWQQEFKSYSGLLDNVAANNGLPDTVKFDFPASSVVGFRAPYLANGSGLYAALKSSGFRYDTSGTSESNLWPEKKDGIWRFNLAGIRLHRSKKSALSMDYNFFVAQSFALDNPATRIVHRDEMLETYLDYFRANYTGNRAPLHIGHHFTAYHGGVYNEALKVFIRKVCGLPDVQCVTYTKLADFMDGLSPETLQAYRNGDFPRAATPTIDSTNTFSN